MKKFFDFVDRLAFIIAWVGVVLIIVLGVMYTMDVIGRLVFHSQFKGTFEIAQFILCAVTFSAYAYTQVKRGHIHVGFIVGRFPKKPKYILSVIEFIMCAVICTITTYALWRLAGFSFAAGKHSAVLQIPFYPIYYLSSIFMAIFALTIIVDIFKSILALKGDPDSQKSIDRIYL